MLKTFLFEMKACKDFSSSREMLAIKAFKVPSKSKKGSWHIVEYFRDGHLVCDCPAGVFKRPCRHKQIVAKRLQKQGFSVETGIGSVLPRKPL